MFFELSDVLQRIHSVPRKTADGLCNDKINLACKGILDHLVEAVTLLCVGAADSLWLYIVSATKSFNPPAHSAD